MAEQVNATLNKQVLAPLLPLFENREELRVQVVIIGLEMFGAKG